MKIMKRVSLGVALLIAANGINAQTVFLNIPSYYEPKTKEYIPTMSFPTSGWDACADAMISYAEENYVRYLGCDVKPFKDAVNMRPRRVK